MASVTGEGLEIKQGRLALANARTISILLVAGIVLLGLAVRLYGLDRYSLWVDEVTSLEVTQRGVQAVFTERFGLYGNQTVWYHILLWLSALPVDPRSSAFFVRLPEALAGALVPLVVYGLGRDLFGRAQGMLAALLTALSLPLIDHSQDARQYSMVVFFTVCMAYCLVRADRTGKPLWWWLFALSTSGSVLISYTSLVLVLPPFGPYLLYLLWRLWKRRGEVGGRSLLSVVTSLVALVVVTILSLLELTRLSRNPLDLSQLSPELFYDVIVTVFGGFVNVGIDLRFQNLLAPLLAIAALLGALWGLSAGGLARKGAYLCGFVSLIPVLTLTVLMTGSPVFSRYVAFGIPFYLLLISQGLIATLEKAGGLRIQLPSKTLRIISLSMILSTLFAYLFGVFIFYTPGGHLELSLRPDFKDVSAYLSSTVKQNDTIIIADQPMHGWKVMNYYWNGNPPTNEFNIDDPRLFTHQVNGDIYWVFWLVSNPLRDTNAPNAPWRLLSANNQGWADIAYFGDVVVLKEAHPSSMLDAMQLMTQKFEKIIPGTYLALTTRGSVQQALGDINGAVAAYQNAVAIDITVSGEDLRTAEGFTSLGMPGEAWYWGVLAKFDQPASPQVHQWLAQSLAAQGYAAESQAELQIAQALEH